MKTLYLITHKIYGKCYVGWTSIEINKYWKKHISQANSKNTKYKKRHIHNAISKYGPDAFNWEIIIVLDTVYEIKLEERYWIERLKDFGIPLYNETSGGEGLPGIIPSEATRKKLSIAHAGKKLSETHKKNISLAHKIYGHPRLGKNLSESTKLKMSLSRLGRFAGENSGFYGKKHNQISKELIRQSRLGTRSSEETKQKQRIANTGKKHTEATKLKISKHNKGWVPTEQTRKNMSISARNKPPVSEATKQKLRETMKKVGYSMTGKNHTEESKIKMRQSHIGKILSKDHKDKISQVTRGSNNPRAKLTEEDVIHLRFVYDGGLYSKKEVIEKYSLKFNMNHRVIERIILRKSWKHVK